MKLRAARNKATKAMVAAKQNTPDKPRQAEVAGD